MSVKIYTDGSSLTNPGPSGWAVIISPIDEITVTEKTRFFTGGFPVATNNQAELNGVLEALRWIKEEGLTGIEIFCDSKYVVDGSNIWQHSWAKKKWNGDIKNIGLWKEIFELYRHNRKPLTWVKGHSTDQLNRFADAIAGKTANAFKEQQVVSYIKVNLNDTVVTWKPGKFQDIVTRYQVLQKYPTSGTIVLKPSKGKAEILSKDEFDKQKFILL